MATVIELVYNCDPESLADVDRDDFEDAFAAELAKLDTFRGAALDVTYRPAVSSELELVRGDDLPESPEREYANAVQAAAERAFSKCCSAN